MYSASDLRKGLTVEIDGAPYVITEFSFSKAQQRSSIYTCKLKNLINGATMVKQFRSTAKVDQPKLDEKTLVYSYKDGDNYVFMDENYEQVVMKAEVLGDARYFLVEDISVDVVFYNGNIPIEIKLPTLVEKKVVKSDPGVRGDTATNVLKPAIVEGGYELQVPLFVNEGDIIRIDTRTGEYSDRVMNR
jgi:elongation factor P